MPTGYEVAMYHHIEAIAREAKAQTAALESIADALGRLVAAAEKANEIQAVRP